MRLYFSKCPGGVKLYGIRFNIPNEYGCILENILHDINVEKYNWYVEYEDILVEPVIEGKPLFNQNIIKGGDFKKKISNITYYIMFLRLYAFPVDKKVTQITSFSNYFASDCELMLFLTSSIFAELYSQNRNLLLTLYSTAEKNNFSAIEIIKEFGPKDYDLLPL